jgi:hypothetical protein
VFGNILSCPWIGLSYNAYIFFSNQSHIFLYYIVMGYQFDQDDSYNSSLNEVLDASTIVDDDAPPVDYRDDTSRHELGQPTLTGTNPPPLAQVTAEDLQFPNEEG